LCYSVSIDFGNLFEKIINSPGGDSSGGSASIRGAKKGNSSRKPSSAAAVEVTPAVDRAGTSEPESVYRKPVLFSPSSEYVEDSASSIGEDDNGGGDDDEVDSD
jgi:acetyl esterase/lipase